MNWLNIYQSLEKINNVLKTLPKICTIVYTYGAWDLLHPGHVILLTRARDLGDFLIVGVVADGPIRDLKGTDRPIQLQNERMITVSSIRCVDAVIAQPKYNPSDQLKNLTRVNILTKGDDWDYIPGEETINKLGGKLIKLGYSKDYSTSSLISQINLSK